MPWFMMLFLPKGGKKNLIKEIATYFTSFPQCKRGNCLAIYFICDGSVGRQFGVDNTFRRKFNREEYLERAREREEEEEEARLKSKVKAPPIQRKPLKHRDYEVDLESRLGKTQVVTPIAPLSQQAGYYCSVCECVVKDSANYLDHINGKKQSLGDVDAVERASLQQVQERFEKLKKQKVAGSFSEQDLDDRIMKQQEEEEERKRQRRERKKEKKKEKAAEEEPEVDADVAAMMGFGGFRSSKK
ncbi:hypothetical protein HPP92_014737 [Vanilla planifolia]|uniref:C2H2-type domain-containing protein n=1 Tax=Vanilla planifolia TaxID=51239 RepID=A0A835QQ35_VANPL|nr:hypothetical protein HPP92_015241 [Vanilla planifolia]KAG0475051.1 hypothetical protein HPP92_014737 [Vanilla planifolia]